ncbi:MAG: ABC transporter ATP-binding protein [Planctomycetota bacterium]|jgi:iron complex transport system ATP-binding protein
MIEIQNLSFAYAEQAVLSDLSVSVAKNEFWAIVGPNGSGKSTLLSLLTNQLKSQSGSVQIDGQDVQSYDTRQLASKLSLVRQEFIPAFGFSVNETVMMGRFNRKKTSFFAQNKDIQAVEAALQATETLTFSDRPLGHLSGGERQRVFIARALAQETPILLLDEPTSHLDLKHQVRIFDLLKQMQIEQGKTILLVTHDINLSCQYCDRVLLLADEGKSYQGSPNEVLDVEHIERTFGVKGYQGRIRNEKFFLPLGRFSKDILEKDPE